MFTGLVQEIGQIAQIKHLDQGVQLTVTASKILERIQIGDSISTSGVCLTVISFDNVSFSADLMFETLNRSTFKNACVGDWVNLEKSLTLEDFLGGHLVLGDIDCTGIIQKIEIHGIASVFQFSVPDPYGKYIAEKGRIAVDGASLTVISAEKNSFSISVIPHTLKNITLGLKKAGDSVNIETDIIAKQLEKLISYHGTSLTEESLIKHGFI